MGLLRGAAGGAGHDQVHGGEAPGLAAAAAEQERAMLGGEVVTWEQLRAAPKSAAGQT